MNTREYKHLHKEKLCYLCDELVHDEENDLLLLTISNRGYGSIFDDCRFSVQLCEKCMHEDYPSWFFETPTVNHYTEYYQHEEKIKALIESFRNLDFFQMKNMKSTA
jgi:hypothetical protein